MRPIEKIAESYLPYEIFMNQTNKPKHFHKNSPLKCRFEEMQLSRRFGPSFGDESYSMVNEAEMQLFTEQHEINSKPSKIDTIYQGEQDGLHQSVLEAPCVICKANEDEENSLLCDSCDMCMHLYCISLACIPDGQWICPWCARSQAIDTHEGGIFLRRFQENLAKKSVAGIILQQKLLDKSDYKADKENISGLSSSSKKFKTVSIIRSYDNKATVLASAGLAKNMNSESDSKDNGVSFQNRVIESESILNLRKLKRVRFANMLEEVIAKVEALADAASHEGRRWTRKQYKRASDEIAWDMMSGNHYNQIITGGTQATNKEPCNDAVGVPT